MKKFIYIIALMFVYNFNAVSQDIVLQLDNLCIIDKSTDEISPVLKLSNIVLIRPEANTVIFCYDKPKIYILRSISQEITKIGDEVFIFSLISPEGIPCQGRILIEADSHNKFFIIDFPSETLVFKLKN
jgi:hypothetical protein